MFSSINYKRLKNMIFFTLKKKYLRNKFCRSNNKVGIETQQKVKQKPQK